MKAVLSCYNSPFALEVITQGHLLPNYYSFVAKYFSNLTRELDFFFLVHDYKLAPVSHRLTTEILLFEYFLAEWAVKPLSYVNDKLRSEVSAMLGVGRSNVFDEVLKNCEATLSKIWNEHFLLAENSQKGVKSIKSAMKDHPKYIATAVLNFYAKNSRSWDSYSFVLDVSNFTHWFYESSLQSFFGVWMRLLASDPDILLARALVADIICDRVSFVKTLLNEAINYEQSRMAEKRQWQLNEGFAMEIFFVFIYKYAPSLNRALKKQIQQFYSEPDLLQYLQQSDTARIIDFLGKIVAILVDFFQLPPNYEAKRVNLLLCLVNSHLMQIYGDTRLESWILVHGVVNLLLQYFLRCLEYPPFLELKVTASKQASFITRKLRALVTMYSCDQQKIFIDVKDDETKTLYRDFLAMPGWKHLLERFQIFNEKSVQFFESEYNRLVAKEFGCEFNEEQAWIIENDVTETFQDEDWGSETIAFLAQHLLAQQSQLVNNLDVTEDLLAFFQQNPSVIQARVGYRRPELPLGDNQKKKILEMSDELGNKNAKSFGGLSSLKKFAAVGGAKNESSENQKTKNVDSKMQIQEALNKIGVQKLELSRKLGSGAYGDVFTASHKSVSIQLAVKILRQYDDQGLKELMILGALSHPSIVTQYAAALVGNQIKALWLVMELCESDLHKYVNANYDFQPPITDATKREWIMQLLQSLDYLESSNIIHRDVKPANILLKRVTRVNGTVSWIPKLSDFGMARKFSCDMSKTISANVGTEIYNAPELWRMKHGLAEQPYEYLVDIWSLGIVFLQMIHVMDSKDLVQFVRTSCSDSVNHFLNPDLVPVLQQGLKDDYPHVLQFYPSLIHMIAPTRDRKSAKELLEIKLDYVPKHRAVSRYNNISNAVSNTKVHSTTSESEQMRLETPQAHSHSSSEATNGSYVGSSPEASRTVEDDGNNKRGGGLGNNADAMARPRKVGVGERSLSNNGVVEVNAKAPVNNNNTATNTTAPTVIVNSQQQANSVSNGPSLAAPSTLPAPKKVFMRKPPEEAQPPSASTTAQQLQPDATLDFRRQRSPTTEWVHGSNERRPSIQLSNRRSAARGSEAEVERPQSWDVKSKAEAANTSMPELIDVPIVENVTHSLSPPPTELHQQTTTSRPLSLSSSSQQPVLNRERLIPVNRPTFARAHTANSATSERQEVQPQQRLQEKNEKPSPFASNPNGSSSAIPQPSPFANNSSVIRSSSLQSLPILPSLPELPALPPTKVIPEITSIASPSMAMSTSSDGMMQPTTPNSLTSPTSGDQLQRMVLSPKKESLVDWCERHNIVQILEQLKGMEFVEPTEFLELTEEDVNNIVIECNMTYGLKARFLKAVKELRNL